MGKKISEGSVESGRREDYYEEKQMVRKKEKWRDER